MTTLLLHNSNNASPADQQPADGAPPEAETRMRRALGLLPSTTGQPPSATPRQRNRGADTVVVVEHRGERGNHGSAHGSGPHGTGAYSSGNRVAVAEAALLEERSAREQLVRQLRDAETALREAQTKRGHAELAHDEAVAALAGERTAREAAEERVRELQQIIMARQVVRHGSAQAAAEPAVELTDAAAPPRRRGRPPGSKAKPLEAGAEAAAPDRDGAVEWWVPGWRERI